MGNSESDVVSAPCLPCTRQRIIQSPRLKRLKSIRPADQDSPSSTKTNSNPYGTEESMRKLIYEYFDQYDKDCDGKIDYT